MSRAASLVAVLEDAASVLIVCHDNPDPDSLASALALEWIAREHATATSDIVYSGAISHQQNRAFVNMFEVGIQSLEAVTPDSYDHVAFVDHSTPGGHTGLADSVVPDIVVDHHPGEPPESAFVDVRTDYGATATIFVEYLLELEPTVPTRLASALLFAIHRERLDFVRDPTEREYDAARAIYPCADLESLEQLYGSAFSAATIDAIGQAIAARTRRGSALATNVGQTSETDALPQAADYLLNLEGVDTVLVYGLVDGAIRLSVRTIDPRVRASDVVTTAFGEFGRVGGHHDMAGGRIDLGLFSEVAGDENQLLEFVRTRLETRFFDALNLDDAS